MFAIGFQQGKYTPQLFTIQDSGDVMLFSETTGEVLDAATDVNVKEWLEEHKKW